MENFSVVYAVCKAALSGDTADGKHQVARLKAALEKRGQAENAEMLERLVKAVVAPVSVASASFVGSEAVQELALPGEPLVSSKHVPVDRETSAPLAQVVEVGALPTRMPVLASGLSGAATALIKEWTHASSLRRLGLEPAKTCLIYGPPGTGKTQLALWMSAQLGLPVILAKLDGLMSSYLGTTSRNIGNLFAYANRYRALLLLDEFDSIAKLRDDPNEVGEIKRVVNTLLQELDRRREHGLTLAITNHPNLLDPAVWRRFESQLEVPMPDAAGREHVIARYLPPVALDPGQTHLLAWALDGCSGSEVEDVVKALKKSIALEPDLAFVDRLQRLSIAHADRIGPSVRQMLCGGREDFARSLTAAHGFNQAKVADVLGVNRSTVNRWLSENTDKVTGGTDGKQEASSVRIKSRGSTQTTGR